MDWIICLIEKARKNTLFAVVDGLLQDISRPLSASCKLDFVKLKDWETVKNVSQAGTAPEE